MVDFSKVGRFDRADATADTERSSIARTAEAPIKDMPSLAVAAWAGSFSGTAASAAGTVIASDEPHASVQIAISAATNSLVAGEAHLRHGPERSAAPVRASTLAMDEHDGSRQ